MVHFYEELSQGEFVAFQEDDATTYYVVFYYSDRTTDIIFDGLSKKQAMSVTEHLNGLARTARSLLNKYGGYLYK